jgi:hypothetical protein
MLPYIAELWIRLAAFSNGLSSTISNPVVYEAAVTTTKAGIINIINSASIITDTSSASIVTIRALSVLVWGGGYH